MNAGSGLGFQPRDLALLLRRHYLVWLVPTVLAAAAATMYTVKRGEVWRASQALIVRDETISSGQGSGRFDDQDARKTAQETVLEMARNFDVVRESLRAVGPPPNYLRPEAWPTDKDVDDARERIAVTAPQGAEFGRTELIYLSVKSPDRPRSLQLLAQVSERLERRLQDLRDVKARSVMTELEQTLALAQADLEDATQRLESMEAEVGSDLGELRILNDSGAGDSNLRLVLNEIQNELRQSSAEKRALEELVALLNDYEERPEALLSGHLPLTQRLVAAQPGLLRLKDGLVDAQLNTARLLGSMTEEHPLVRGARKAEELVRQDLQNELEQARRGLEADMQVVNALVEELVLQRDEVRGRLDRLAALRTRYGLLVDEVRQRTEIVEQSQRNLSQARANLAAARGSSLVTQLDQPRLDPRPVGPGKASIIAAGGVGGLIIGLGLLSLVAPLQSFRRRRWSDHAGTGSGRRSSDPATGRRWSDQGGIPFGRRSSDRDEKDPTNKEEVGDRDEPAPQAVEVEDEDRVEVYVDEAEDQEEMARPSVAARSAPSADCAAFDAEIEDGGSLTLSQSLARLQTRE